MSHAPSLPASPSSRDLAAPDRPLGLDEALAFLAARTAPVVGIETRGLAEACGRVLAADVVSPLDSPPFAAAAMDGFALRHADLPAAGATARLSVAARIAAGHPAAGCFGPGQAARIFTGAPLPDGLDTVVMQEDCTVGSDGGVETVEVPGGIAPGTHVRPRGEDIAAGSVVLRAGRRLRPQDVAMAATVGRPELSVFRRLRVGVLSTGDEVVEPGRPLPPGAIYGSNRYSLLALAQGLGCAVEDLGNLPDRLDATRDALAAAAARFDLLITSGGVSVGGEDHVRDAIAALGAVHLWRLALKPGKSTALGHVAGTAFIGLSGYPVAAQVMFMMLARPLILRLSGAVAESMSPWRFKVPAAAPFAKNNSRRHFVRARLQQGPDGEALAVPYRSQDSAAVSSLVEGDGLVDLREEVRCIPAGQPVDFIPFQTVQW